MSQLGIMKTVARAQLVELGPLSDDQLRAVNKICQAFYDVGKVDGAEPLKTRVTDAQNCLACAGIEDPLTVCATTLTILSDPHFTPSEENEAFALMFRLYREQDAGLLRALDNHRSA